MNRTKHTTKKSAATPIMALVTVITIFAVTAVLTFGGRRALGRSLDTQPTQAELLQARAEAVAAIPKLPKDTEERLAAALYPQLAPVTAAFSDPIARAGSDDPTGMPNRVRFNAASTSAAALPLAPPVPEKLSRLTQWQQSVRAAIAAGTIPPPITTAYLISEVRPTGRVDMKGNQGAWLYIEAEKRQIPANLGAKFYDGVLASIDPDPNTGGVVFRTSTGQTTMLHWDSQEDFTGTSPISHPTSVRELQAEPQHQLPESRWPKPVTQNSRLAQPYQETPISPVTPVTAVQSISSTHKPTREDYSDLQIAVRDRYRSTPLPGPSQHFAQATNQPATNLNTAGVSSSTRTSDQPENAALITTTTNEQNKSSIQPLSGTNSFSTGTFRGNKLNYAHAVYSSYTTRPKIRTTSSRQTQPNIFDLDDPNSFDSPPDRNEEPSSLDVSLDHKNEPTTENPPINDLAAPDQDKTRQPVSEPTETQTQKRQESTKAAPQPSLDHHAGAPAEETPRDPKRGTLCDPTFRGENITITNESNRPLSLLNLVNRLNENYGPNIVLDYDVQETPIRLTINNAPWTSILRTLLDLNDLDMVCLDGGIVQIAKRSKIASMGDLRRRSAPIVREVFRLRYLQQTAGGRANLAGQTQASNGATIQSLEDAIRDILKAGGDPRGEARRVPGRNQLLVAATHEQMDEIRDLISRVDRPGYQVKISALVYTANENRLRDIGSQLAIVVGNSAATNLAGGATLAATQTAPTTPGGSTTPPPSGLNPGGIPALAQGMRPPTNGLGAANPLATFGVTSLFGTAQFAYQLTLAQQKGH